MDGNGHQGLAASQCGYGQQGMAAFVLEEEARKMARKTQPPQLPTGPLNEHGGKEYAQARHEEATNCGAFVNCGAYRELLEDYSIVNNTLKQKLPMNNWQLRRLQLARGLVMMEIPLREDTVPGAVYQGDYKYGFNGMGVKKRVKAASEVKGEGMSYDFGARVYDPRVGRWWSRDPLEVKYPGISSYAFVNNMPTIAIDQDGRDIRVAIRYAMQPPPYVHVTGNMTMAVTKYDPVKIKVEGSDEPVMYYKKTSDVCLIENLIHSGKTSHCRAMSSVDAQEEIGNRVTAVYTISSEKGTFGESFADLNPTIDKKGEYFTPDQIKGEFALSEMAETRSADSTERDFDHGDPIKGIPQNDCSSLVVDLLKEAQVVPPNSNFGITNFISRINSMVVQLPTRLQMTLKIWDMNLVYIIKRIVHQLQGKVQERILNLAQLTGMSNNSMKMRSIFMIVLSSLSFGINGQLIDERFLVRKETNLEMVFAVRKLQVQDGLADGIRLDSSKCRVLYNGCGKLYLVSKSDDWHFHLNSIETTKGNQCPRSSISSVKFDDFLWNEIQNERHGIISDLEYGITELKCNESSCLIYRFGLRLFEGLDHEGEVIYPRGGFLGGKWSFDFFREKYLIVLGRYFNPKGGFESHLYFFDLEEKQLLWSHKFQNIGQPLDIKVMGDNVYVVFRKYSPEGYSIPSPPSHCIIATIEIVGMVPQVTFRAVDRFDGSIIEIL